MRGYAEMSTAILIALTLLCQGVESSVRVTSLHVPRHAVRYSNQTLTCSYEMANKKLYSIKWYHNNKEFLRYTPNDDTKLVLFNTTLIKVNMEASTGETVVLQEIDLSASGKYMCEVHTEYPEFTCVDKEATMTVVVIPEEQPNIEGDVTGHYGVGDTVKLNCTAAPSIPEASLVWFINDKQAPKEFVHEYELEKLSDGLAVSRLGLDFKLSQSDFIHGELKLKCTATIATLYHSSDEHSQQDPTAQVKEVRERPEEGSLVTSTDEGSSSTSVSGGLIKRLLALHATLLITLHLLR
ncbi:cell adhesion molecule 2 isoform X2 [Procambarus clarkii]|uniref:cell adhesion molecule 2 isoform X2 n=1 Tax=Procambarus clarkii TaxID=6728 RepID=UPI001E67433D|nr:uncharacterized protein LOC123774604 isoform X2 [Procambarus clarkii]